MKKLIAAEQIAARVAELGAEITDFCQDDTPTVLLMVMNGAVFFAADLARQVRRPLFLDSIGVSSYDGAVSGGKLCRRANTKEPVAGRRVLLVDDIFDTGVTLSALTEELRRQGAVSVEAAVMLCKQVPRQMAWRPRWIGFEVPDCFIVGYGLDYNSLWRNLPDIYGLEPADFAGK